MAAQISHWMHRHVSLRQGLISGLIFMGVVCATELGGRMVSIRGRWPAIHPATQMMPRT
ncbi:MAG: hypothetical protein CM15mP120_28340 [Pseudomonadota bacterium]|nr:MAG: hypothetical protein CM15mP120_28340 [Pseudomonadota bacterium]